MENGVTALVVCFVLSFNGDSTQNNWHGCYLAS